jgi:WD40 repeat protein
MRYDGFISYSHAADGRLAPALQKALQKLAKPWFRRRSLEIFRDETGLSVDPHLWGAIVKALDDSEWFLVLTSPLAAQSEWVGREIEHWRANRSVDRILPILTDGHWEWDDKTGDFTPESDAVPPALRGVFTDEPRHLDLRWAREEQQVDLNNGRFRNAVAEIAAPLHGVSKDQIEGEDVRQHRRTVRIAWSAAATLAVLTVAAVVAGGVAVVNADRAEQRRIQADAQRLAAQSQTELEQPDLAFLLAAHGYRLYQSERTESALLTSVANLPEIKQRIRTDSPVKAVAMSDAADRVWIGTADGDVIVHRFSDGEQLGRADGLFVGEVLAMTKLADDTVVATDGTVVTTIDGASKKTLVRVPGNAVLSLAAQPSTGRVAAGTADGKVLVWERDRADPSTSFVAVPDDADGQFASISALAWTPDGAVVVASKSGSVRRYDLDATDNPVWEEKQATRPGDWVSAVAVVQDGTVVTGGTDGSVGFWNASDGTLTDAAIHMVHVDSVRGLAATGEAAEAGSVASVGDDGSVVYWNHLTGGVPLSPIRVDERAANSVAWDPANPDRGVTGGQAGGALLFEYGDDERRPLSRTIEGLTNAALVALSPAGDRLAVVRAEPNDSTDTPTDGTAPVIELVLTEPDNPEPDGPSARMDADVERLTFTPDGTLLLAGMDNGTVAVWDGKTSEATFTQVAPGQPVNRLAVSPDGTTIATGALDLEADTNDSASVRLWRMDGRRLVEQDRVEDVPYGYGLAFTQDGTRLVIGGADKLAIRPVKGGKTVTVDLEDDIVRSLAVSPDGATAAVGLWSGPVRLIDLTTGEQTGDDMRVASRVTDLAFRDDGNVLVTVSEDGSFILWDLATRSRFSDRTLTAVDSDAAGGGLLATSLGVGADLAVTASIGDGRVRTWALDPEDWIREGCDVHQRELTDAEKERYSLEGMPPVCVEG